jgi:DNA-binding CsgD family transcriptional regulator
VLVVAARVLGALGAAWAGERPPAVDPLAQLDAFDDRSLSAHPTVLLHVSRALLRLGRTDEATVLLRRAVAIARRTSSGEMLVWLLGVQAWALWLALDLDAEARLLQGRALAAAGETERAKAVLQRLAADAARVNAQRLMSAAARELRGLGTRVSATARRHERAELSEREREIAQLVADGNSNKQVAATLYLSEKTVENALTRVYAKVGVRSRVQLARAWA